MGTSCDERTPEQGPRRSAPALNTGVHLPVAPRTGMTVLGQSLRERGESGHLAAGESGPALSGAPDIHLQPDLAGPGLNLPKSVYKIGRVLVRWAESHPLLGQAILRRRVARSSRGPGHRPLKAEIAGSNPARATKSRHESGSRSSPGAFSSWPLQPICNLIIPIPPKPPTFAGHY